MPRNAHSSPSARQIQPIGLWERLEAMRAPTTGKAKTGTDTNMSIGVTLASKSPGSRAERASTHSVMLATNMASERPASDQASRAEARVLILPAPRPIPWRGE